MSFPTPILIEDKSLMKNARVTVMTFVALLLASALLTPALAQKAAQHLLSSDELTKVAPAEFFFRGQKATVQLRNATGFETAGGMVTFGALVDASGYSSGIKETYQGMLL